MSQRRFIRCPHCSLPHEADERRCPTTGRSIPPPPPRRARAASDSRPSWTHEPSRASEPGGSHLDPSDLDTLRGQILDSRYRVQALIGRGGSGAVYRAEDLTLGRRVAVKVLYRNVEVDRTPEERFLREAQAVGQLGHPHIVALFELGRLRDGKPYQVMELLEGETLAERIRLEGALPEGDVLRIAEQVLSALCFAHERGLIHRDLKPDNVFLVSDGEAKRAKLLDFGSAKSLEDRSLALTRTGVVVGTPYYLAPEQARGQTELDHRVDLWGMGVLLYESLTGVLPFNAPTYEGLLRKILTTSPLPPSRFRPKLTPAVERLVLWAMAPDPNARPESAGELLEGVRAARRSAAERTDRHPAFELEGAGDRTARDSVPPVPVEPDPDEPTRVHERDSVPPEG